jgi:hypothetical protein
MNRRTAISHIAVSTLTGFGFIRPARAVVPPPILVAIGYTVEFIFQRYVIPAAIGFLARNWPRVFASDLRKYLLVALAHLGFNEARASVLGEAAEENGAQNVAKNGVEMSTELLLKNGTDSPIELVGVKVQLIDAERNLVELESTGNWGLVIDSQSTSVRNIVASNFPSVGFKRWHLVTSDGTIAASKKFLVVA